MSEKRKSLSLNFSDPSNIVSYARLKNISHEKLKKLLKVSSSSDGFVSDEPGKLCLLQKPTLRLVFEKSKNLISLPLSGLLSLEKKEKNTLVLKFFEKEQFEYTAEFEFPSNFLFEVFRKTLLSTIKSYDVTFIPPPIEKKKNLVIPTHEDEGVIKRGAIAFSQSTHSAGSRGPHFSEISASDWEWCHVEKWMKHVLCQISFLSSSSRKKKKKKDEEEEEEEENEVVKIVSLLQILESRQMKNPVRDYLSVEGQNVCLLLNQLQKLIHKKNSSSSETIDARLTAISRNRNISILLIESLEELKRTGWMFDLSFTTILPKIIRLETLKQQQRRRRIKDNQDDEEESSSSSTSTTNPLIIDLKKIKDDLLMDESCRSYWDVTTLRRRMISMIIWGTGIQERIEYLENQFHQYLSYKERKQHQKKKKKEKEKEEEEEEEGEKQDDDDDDSEEEEEVNEMYYPDPDIFESSLLKFNEINLCFLHRLSFNILIETKRNQYLKRRVELISSFEENLQAFRELGVRLSSLKKEKEESDQKISQLTDKMILSETDEEQLKFEDELKIQEDFSRELVLKIQEIEEKIEEYSEDEKLKKNLSDINDLIIKCTPKLYESQKLKFLTDEKRGELIDQWLISSLQSRQSSNSRRKDNNNIKNNKEEEFDVLIYPRLVLARAMKSEPAKFASKIMSYVVDPLARPDFFQFGFLHSGISIFRCPSEFEKNKFLLLRKKKEKTKDDEEEEEEDKKYPRINNNTNGFSIHWFSTNLCFVLPKVCLGDPYDEIVHLDLGLPPLLLNYRTLLHRINNIAEKIIFYNLNYEYSDFNFMEIKGRCINCQEITLEILKILSDTPNYNINNHQHQHLSPFLKSWLDRMKKISMDSEKIKGEEYIRCLFLKDINEEIKEQIRWITNKPIKTSEVTKFEEVFRDVIGRKLIGKTTIQKNDGDDDDRIVFHSHEDLDQFYNDCRAIDPDFEFNFHGVCRLLKAFDDAYWMRLACDENSEIHQESVKGCPFRNL